MDIRDKGIQTQLRAIGEATGLTWDQLKAEVLGWPEGSHTALRTRVQETWGLGLMHAETVVLCARLRQGDPLEVAREWYTGAKEAFWPIHETLLPVLAWDGVEAVAKKGYLSVRRTKQFATWGPTTNTRFELGLNGKHLAAGGRLVSLPPGQICHFKVVLTSADQVDEELLGWLRSAYDRA